MENIEAKGEELAIILPEADDGVEEIINDVVEDVPRDGGQQENEVDEDREEKHKPDEALHQPFWKQQALLRL